MALGYRRLAHNLTLLVFSVGFGVLSAAAADANAGLSGRVVDSTGKPQLGAIVEVFGTPGAAPLRAFTDAKGFYAVANLIPGTYFIKATATTFLPSIRENVNLDAGSHLMV